MMRATTIKASGDGVGRVIGYYAGLAEDQVRRDGISRGPVEYYLDPHEPPGRWWGEGCGAVGLSGEVRPEQMVAMLTARHPVTGAKVGRGFGDRSARAFDATFSAPKSVSVAWALAEDPWVRAVFLAAQDAAVLAALGWTQRHGAVTRRGAGGIYQLDTQGLVVAIFRQHTSRTVDPHLHTHAVIWVKVLDREGHWLALDARFLKFQQRSIGWVYAAALRTELTRRLGLRWGPVVDGHADIADTEPELMRLFSERSAQVEARHAELISDWVEGHEGVEPDARTIARLERQAVLDSRPPKDHAVDAEELRTEWRQRALAAGLEPPALSAQRGLSAASDWDPDEVISQALQRCSEQGSSWLQADVAREIATLLPADATSSGEELVELVDRLATDAMSRCVELHPPARDVVPTRGDGRPVTEAVTDRRRSTSEILAQEARLIAWAKRWSYSEAPPPSHDPQEALARAVAGHRRLVLVVGPAGAGKTTTLARAADMLRSQGRAVVGLAPSGKAADVLAAETGCPSSTLAKFLYDHDRPDAYGPDRLPQGTTVILDEASMASTEDLDRLVRLVDRQGLRLVCVGDPAQLPAVGRGGMFEQWCETVPAHHLERIHRFADDWQGPASLALRQGDPKAAATYAAHNRLETVHPSLVADQVARLYAGANARGHTVAITCASTNTAIAINVAIQRQRNPLAAGAGVGLRDGTQARVGDTIATRCNHARLVTTAGATVRNRHTWTVTAVGDDGSLTVADPKRGTVTLPAAYVRRHVELGWAVTGYGSQGITTDHAICVVEPSSTRAGVYVGMTRGRRINRALILDRSGTADAVEELTAIIARPARSLTAHMVRQELYRAAGLQPPAPAVDPPVRTLTRRRKLSL